MKKACRMILIALIQTLPFGSVHIAQSQQGLPESVQLREEIAIELPGLPEGAKPLEMILIRPGSFTMGAPDGEPGRSENEWPAHKVLITQPFYIGKYEVTQAQWESVMGENPSWFRGSDDHPRAEMPTLPDHPVERVSWNACQDFIEELNELAQGTFRLPTEAEWEYACRAGTETVYSFGDTLEDADKYMWWSGNNDPHGTKEVGQKLPNPWGLYDMHGNVQEWCSDLWRAPFKRKPQIDAQGPSWNWHHHLWSSHVFRGGGYERSMVDATWHSAFRASEQRFDFHCSLGLRLVREQS